jgi:dTDP-4-amino-4,6-dideoxygalactose transaminase
MSSINVTQSFLPPLEEYTGYLGRIWENKWVTNRGPLVLDLEQKIKSYLKIQNIIITNNGTVPLQIAVKLFGNNGEIITTPFSYVATSAAIVWENCKPIFVDIHPDYLTIDETKIEDAITDKTTCILATHVFGNPCHLNSLKHIAKKHNLKLIYDAAHSFGVNYDGQSVFNYGDVSTCSFHATKLFHTGEGGAMMFNDSYLYDKLFYSHNFGHNGQLDFYGLGINGKISELQSAMGLSILPYVNEIISERKKIVDFYNQYLKPVQRIKIREKTEWNYSYYPIILELEEQLVKLQFELNKMNIFPRRYFYPSLNTIGYLSGQEMSISESVSKRILCLPLFVGLNQEQQAQIINIINKYI